MYKYLTKEEKKDIRSKYEKTKRGSELTKTLNRLFLEGAFLIICFIVIMVAIFIMDLAGWYWIFVVLSLIFGIVFLIGQQLIRVKEYNRFIEQTNKNKKSSKNKLTKNK